MNTPVMSLLFVLIAMPLRSQTRDTSSVSPEIETFRILESMAGEHIAVVQLCLLSTGSLPGGQSDFDGFTSNNHLNVDKKYWKNCTYKRTGETAEILVKVDDDCPAMVTLAGGASIIRARAVLYINPMIRGRKSSIVSVSGELMSADIMRDGHVSHLGPYYYNGNMVLWRLTEQSLVRLIGKD